MAHIMVSISTCQIVTSCSCYIIIIILHYNNSYYVMIVRPLKNGNSVTVYMITAKTPVIWDRILIPLLIKLDIAYYHIYTVEI